MKVGADAPSGGRTLRDPAPAEGLPAVLITGLRSGIGAACARTFAAAGYRVLGVVRPEATAEDLDPAMGHCGSLVLDLATPLDPDAVRLRLRQLLPGPQALDGLLLCAGQSGVAPATDDALLRRLLEVNLLANVSLVRACLPSLQRPGGRILILGSRSAREPLPFLGAYAASKAALEAWAAALGQELEPSGITVTLVSPGAVATGMAERLSEPQDEARDHLPFPWLFLGQRRLLRLLRADAQRGLPPSTVAARMLDAYRSPRPPRRIDLDGLCAPGCDGSCPSAGARGAWPGGCGTRIQIPAWTGSRHERIGRGR